MRTETFFFQSKFFSKSVWIPTTLTSYALSLQIKLKSTMIYLSITWIGISCIFLFVTIIMLYTTLILILVASAATASVIPRVNSNFVFITESSVFRTMKLSNQDDVNVKLDVYFEGLCSDSKAFITEQLGPQFESLSSFVDLRLIPFGKATVIISLI